MFSARGMAKFLICALCLMVAFDWCSAERNRNRSRKTQLKRQSKRQQNSEITSDCMDPPKKFLRMKYETGLNETERSGFAMLPGSTVTMASGASDERPRAAKISTCPSIAQHQNFDSTRWPKTIVEAACECEYCYLGPRDRRMNVGGENCPGDAAEHPVGYCRPITREIAVLRKAGCVGDFEHYDWGSVTVTVGCECVIGRKP